MATSFHIWWLCIHTVEHLDDITLYGIFHIKEGRLFKCLDTRGNCLTEVKALADLIFSEYGEDIIADKYSQNLAINP